MKIVSSLLLFVLLLSSGRGLQDGGRDDAAGMPLRVSDNGRFLVRSDGSPFFYLADTAWELFHRLTREEAERYLEKRRQQGFTVIQAVVLAELDGLRTPNAYGDLPLVDEDPRRLNEAYFKHVDWVVKSAEQKGLFIGMLPTWGDKVVLEHWGIGPVIFTNPDVAREYGRQIGRRYRDAPNIIWINGGDRRGGGHEPIWDALAEGLREGDGAAHLITYHPGGGHSSSEWFHDREWLDFNMLQSGHAARDSANYELLARDYARTPVKPTLDGEPRYEDHPINWDPKNGWFDDFDVRQAVYWSLFAGGFGVTYGCHDVWQMYTPERKPISSARTDWRTALDLPGAWQMRHVRRLLESRPFLERVPDQGLIAGDPGTGPDHVRATRGERYAFVYIPTGKPTEIRLDRMTGSVRAEWFDPRTGATTPIGTFPAGGTRRFTPPGTPGRGNDWVLVLDW
ncbi:MAG TPA: glycoside hydrolase family 140 protein [Vicinamibacterales bacterium]|nr:glycoside hydrolase family 140 protein [Vicinamibacterales bacterium]